MPVGGGIGVPSPGSGSWVISSHSLRNAIRAESTWFVRLSPGISFVLVPYVIIAFALFTIWRDVHQAAYTHAAYAAVNALLCAYAVVAFIGIRHSLVDVWSNVVQRIWQPVERVEHEPVQELDWVTVLYDGAQTGGGVALPSATALRSTESRVYADRVAETGAVGA